MRTFREHYYYNRAQQLIERINVAGIKKVVGQVGNAAKRFGDVAGQVGDVAGQVRTAADNVGGAVKAIRGIGAQPQQGVKPEVVELANALSKLSPQDQELVYQMMKTDGNINEGLLDTVKRIGNAVLDAGQMGLTAAGMIPVVGNVADAANAGISLARGDLTGAGLNAAAALGPAGYVANIAKAGRFLGKAAKAGVKGAGSAIQKGAAGIGAKLKAAGSALKSPKVKQVTDVMSKMTDEEQEAMVQTLSGNEQGQPGVTSGTPAAPV
jgi:hypothetical protein